jgi:hypothetical protein
MADLHERFWSHVRVAELDECWLWCGYINKWGQGRIEIRGKTCIASRVAWILTNGEILPDLCVCHACDRPACCNPNHMFLGTHADNQQDKKRKNRQAKGEKNGRAKLLPGLVREIIQSNAHPRDLATSYGVTENLIRLIKQRKIWRHI